MGSEEQDSLQRVMVTLNTPESSLRLHYLVMRDFAKLMEPTEALELVSLEELSLSGMRLAVHTVDVVHCGDTGQPLARVRPLHVPFNTACATADEVLLHVLSLCGGPEIV